MRMSSHLPMHRPHLAFVNASAQSAFATLDRVATVGAYVPTVTYPANGFAQALRAVAGALATQIGTRVFWVQTGGYDTHAAQSGTYGTLMTTLNDGLLAFYQDLNNHGLLNDTLILQFSEFGRRIIENGSGGTDHGAASVMMAIGGQVRGGIYGTAPSLVARSRQSHARERRERRATRNRLPLGLRARHRQLARRRLVSYSRRRLPRRTVSSCETATGIYN